MKQPLEDVIETMRTRDINIQGVPVQPPGSERVSALKISFHYSDPHKAQQVVQTLIAKFIEYSIEDRRSAAYIEATSDRVAQLERRIAALEQKLDMPPQAAPQAGQPGPAPVMTLDSPNLPERPAYSDRAVFMAAGFGAGFVLALAIAILRRPAPLPPPKLA